MTEILAQIVIGLLIFGVGLAIGLAAGIARERSEWLAIQRTVCGSPGVTPDEVARRFEEERRAMERLSIDPLAAHPEAAVPAHDRESIWGDVPLTRRAGQ